MKIALVILHADPARGGAERYTIDLAAGLARRGHDVSILASSFAELPAAVSGITMRATGMIRVGRYIRFLNSVDAAMHSGGYDIVHAMLPVRRCDVYHPHAGIAVEAIKRGHLKHRKRISQTIAGCGNQLNLRRQRFGAVEKELLTGNDSPMVLCLSGKIQSTVQQYYPNLPVDRLVVLFNSVDLNRFDPTNAAGKREQLRQKFGFSSDDIVGLMLAQDFERKGLRQAIEAIAKVQRSNVRLLVAGRQDPTVYKQLAQSLGVADRVHFNGPTDDPVAFYAAADFFVLPTRADPCSLVVLEALAMGVPVISTSANGACEIMMNHNHGRILEDPADVSALADAMLELSDADKRAMMSAACLNLRPKLAFESHLTALENVYDRVHP